MILFRDVRLLRFDPPAASEPVDVLCGDDGRIAALGPRLADGPAAGVPEGGSGGFLSPALVQAHAHLYSLPVRAARVRFAAARDFPQLLEKVWWRLDKALDLPCVRAAAACGAAEAALRGVACLVDHHSSPACAEGSLGALSEGLAQVGLRGVLCYETSDRDGPHAARAGLQENERWAREAAAAGAAGGAALRAAMVGAHAPFTLGDETLERLGDLCGRLGLPLHVHAAEDPYDGADGRRRYGLEPLDRLDRAGCLGEDALVAHGLYLSPEDLELLRERRGWIVHAPRSNMGNGVGYARHLERMEGFLLGTDGHGADMLEEARFARFRNLEEASRRGGTALEAAEFARALGRNIRFASRRLAALRADGASPGVALGALAPGAPADLVHWDYAPPTPLDSDNLAEHLLSGLSSRDVRSVLVAGRFVVRDRRPEFDLERIAAKGREEAERLWRRMEER